ncbi:restriction endonuclease [Nitrosopumilus sp.]|nr:restriction endonuclease [Nitrosopumilus sp.]
MTITFADRPNNHVHKKVKNKKTEKNKKTDVAIITFASVNVNVNGRTSIVSDDIETLTFEEAEDLVGKLFEANGYDVTIGVTAKDGSNKRSQDGGIDVRVEKGNKKIGIQVKHWKDNVSFPSVSGTLGVSKGFTKMIVISTISGFTKSALEFAKENHDIELWDSKKFKKELNEHRG